MDRKQKRPAVVAGLLLLILMLGMGLRLYELDADSMWLDEIITANQARQDLSSILTYNRGSNYTHPPLIHLVTRFFIAAAGNSDFVLRTQAMLFGSLAILLTYKVGETLWNKEVGLVGSALLAANAYHVQYSQEARSYALMVFLALLSLLFLFKALEGNRTRFWLGFILCTSLSLYNHYFAALFLPAAVVLAACVIGQNWMSLRRRHGRDSEGHTSHGPSLPASQSLWFLLSLIVVGVSYIPWLPVLRTHIAFFTGYQGQTVAAVASLESSLSLLHTMAQQCSGLSGVPLGLWVGVFAFGLVASDLKRRALVASWVGTPFVFLAVVRSGFASEPRYVIFVLPLVLLVIARGITSAARALASRLPAARGNREWLVPGIVTLTVLIFISLSVPALRDYYSSEKEDWRGATAYLLRNMEATDIIIADGQDYGPGGDAGRAVKGLTHYFSLAYQNATVFRAQVGLANRLDDVTDQSASAWGVLWFDTDLTDGQQVGPGFEVIEFSQVAVVRPLASDCDLLEKTQALLETLVLLQPLPDGRIDLHLALAEIHLRDGNQADAHRQAEMAAAAIRAHQSGVGPNPRLADAYSDLGSVFEKMGRPHEALAAYRQAVEIEPDHLRARRRLDLLSGALDEDVPSPLFRTLGFQIGLLGYGLDSTTVRTGRTVDVTLWWLALARMDKDYTAFIHLTDEEGRLWAQDDRILEDNGHLTSTWGPAAAVKQEFQVQLSPDLPSGEYTLLIGVYYWETGERLAVRDLDGQSVTDDAISLGVIIVVK